MILKKLKNIKVFYLFNFLAVCLLIVSVTMYFYYDKTKNNIFNTNNKANIQYVKSLADNLNKDITRIIDDNFIDALVNDIILIDYIKADLKLFKTIKYKYIYLVIKDKNSPSGYKIVIDSSETKTESDKLIQSYKNLDKNKFDSIYNNSSCIYNEKSEDNIDATYMKPILLDNKVQAVLVIVFSLNEKQIIAEELNQLQRVFLLAIFIFLLVFILIVWFSYMDLKREKSKLKAFEAIKKLNSTLEARIEKELEKNKAQNVQMLQQSRLAQMGEMISMIAHQWRQPLAAISAASAAINIKAQLGLLDNDTAVKQADKISEFSQHLSQTIDDFRDFFRTNKEKKETTCNKIIKSTMSIVEVGIRNNNIDLILELNCDNPIYTYENEMKQVVLNLIKNAKDVLLEKNIENPYIKITAVDSTITVSDNGGGISDNLKEKIFDPYFSTKDAKNGTGLGLYMSKTIVEDHCGGKLTVENDTNGAVFKIVFN